jgi:hypothetical protein
VRAADPSVADPYDGRSINALKETHMTYDFNAARAHFAAKLGFTTGPHEVTGMIDQKKDIVIVDVRFPTDYRKAHILGAVNVPKGKWHEAAACRRTS